MKECIAVMFICFTCADTGRCDAVVLRNNTGKVVTVWTREDGSRSYKKVVDGLWNTRSAKIHVARMPFFVAISTRSGSYSYVGPFDRGLYKSGGGDAEIIFNAKSVSETRVRLVEVWDPRRRQMTRRQVPEVVSREIAYAQLTGLSLGGADLATAPYSGSETAASRYAADAAVQEMPAAADP